MKRHFHWLLTALLATAGAATRADVPSDVRQDASSDEASLRDLQKLQQDLETLDDDLTDLERTSPAEGRRLRERADSIREDAVYLKVKMRRRQSDHADGTGVTMAEVRDLRRDVAELRSEIEKRDDHRAAAGDLRVPAGTELSIRLDQSLSSETAVTEDTVQAEILRPVRIDGAVAIPAGSELRGIVRSSQAAQRLQRPGRLELDFDALYVDGRRLDLRTSVVALQDENATRSRNEKAGIGAVLGGVLGGLLKGRSGAVIGVLAGGGAVVAQKGEDVELPEGTVLKVRLEKPLTVLR
jgi:hypothetical protein